MKTARRRVTSIPLQDGELRAVHIHCPGSAVAYFGVAVRAGSRDELPGDFGLAHFVEHTIFKGTDRRRASHIIKRMESVGGELNAYTTKEETVVYSIFPSGNLSRAVELIADLIVNSRFPEAELDKEREVVADEIDSYLDAPSEAVFDDFEDLIFAGSPLGHSILGSAASLKSFDSARCRSFIERHYRAGGMVAFYSGPQGAPTVFRTLERLLASIPAGGNMRQEKTEPEILPPFDEVRNIPTHQAHCLLGARVPGYMSPERVPVSLSLNMLGGPGMNSLLNVELRERRGLVYTVEASTSLFSDCGLATVYFGCDPEDRNRCIDIVRRVLDRFDQTVSPQRLESAKKQYLGQLTVASENRENTVLAAARSLLWRGYAVDPAEIVAGIRDVSLDEIIGAVRRIRDSLSILSFTP